MAMARALGALRARFPAADRMWVIGDAAEVAGAGRRGWVVRERLLALAPAATMRSAGMSADLEAAISSGATHIRLGSALLGHRRTFK